MSNKKTSEYIKNIMSNNSEHINKTIDSFTNFFLSFDDYINNSLVECKMSIIIFLIFYCILISIVNIPKFVHRLFKNNIFKIFLILILSYFAMKDTQIVIFIIIAYLLTLYKNENCDIIE